jgi:hypothetical protein
MRFDLGRVEAIRKETNWNNNNDKRQARRTIHRRRDFGFLALVLCSLTICLGKGSYAQASLPFEVSNPKHLSWSVEEAGRIYTSACQLVARSLHPEKPPYLQPKFVLILGAKADQMIRSGPNSVIQLRKWDPARFAEAMVLLTLREAVKNEDVMQLARDALTAAQSTVSVNELRQNK